ncbi:MAG: CpaF family protein [Gemmatimonadota bacterium]|nr:CpaF family protein [Gemmatimonadota bacterium]MDQ8173673.1 CpaF family protein [Gemmatimonadota bacterium]
MSKSLRDRLLGLGTTPDRALPAGELGAPGEAGDAVALVGTDPLAGLTIATPFVRGPVAARAESAVDRLKRELHSKLVERLDLSALDALRADGKLEQQIRAAVLEFLRTEQAPLSAAERDEVIDEITWEVTGLGPIEPLTRDLSISDILVNGPHAVYVERGGQLELTDITFRDNAHLLAVIDRIVSRVGRRVDESSPMVDARLPDGSRVNAVIPPLALDGPVLSIRRFGATLGPADLVSNGAMTAEMLRFLAACVVSRLNILISGGTGSGKTTLLNALSAFIPDNERIVTIEDAAELRLQQQHVVRLETRPPNMEGRGEVLARDLVKNALRMRPDRIIIGEVRSAESLDMLQAMNTGHEGSLTTVHANTPRDALARLETMVLFAGTALPVRAVREQVAAALHLVVQVSRGSDGRRRVTSIAEVTTMEGDMVSMQEIFRFRRRGVSEDGTVQGSFEATGVRPQFAEAITTRGIALPADLFVIR